MAAVRRQAGAGAGGEYGYDDDGGGRPAAGGSVFRPAPRRPDRGDGFERRALRLALWAFLVYCGSGLFHADPAVSNPAAIGVAACLGGLACSARPEP